MSELRASFGPLPDEHAKATMVSRIDAHALLDVAELAYAYRLAVKRAAPYETVTHLARELDEALRAFDWEQA